MKNDAMVGKEFGMEKRQITIFKIVLIILI